MKKYKPTKIIKGILLLIVFCTLFKLFIFGSPFYANQANCQIYENGTTVKLRVVAFEPAVAFHGWKHTRYGNTINITGRRVLVSPLFNSGHYETIIDVTETDCIILGDMIIWVK